jgi:AcrR family transcriptional regulator
MEVQVDGVCEFCERSLRPAERGRPPRYCSQACRARAYRSRQADERVARPPEPARTDPGLTAERIVQAAITVADREWRSGRDYGALSMRRTAAELGAGVMSLYRHVPGKDELVDLVVDAIFGQHPLPEPGPQGWRAKLEISARQEWSLYHQHPWLTPLVAATTRPPIAVGLMAYTDWRMRAVQDASAQELDLPTMTRIAVAVSTVVQGAALALAHEARVGQQGQNEWLASRQGAIDRAFASGRLPMVSRFGAAEYRAAAPEAIFEFGLQRTLDGIATLLSTIN